MFLAVLCGLASPLRSAHILWINLITDSLPALALGIDENDKKALMLQPPRKSGESLFANGALSLTCFYGILIASISLAAFFIIPFTALRDCKLPITMVNLSMILQKESVLLRAQTYAFTVLGMSQLFHAIGMRDRHTSVFFMNHGKNKLMLFSFIIGFALQFAVTEISFLRSAFCTVNLSPREWGVLMALAAFPLLAHEILILTEDGAKTF